MTDEEIMALWRKCGMPTALREGGPGGPLQFVRALLSQQAALLTSLQTEVADALWMVLRECEDKCDLELSDIGTQHVVWQLANVAIGTIATRVQPQADAAAKETP